MKVQALPVGFSFSGPLSIDGAVWVKSVADAISAPEYASGGGPVLTSPNGTRYRLTVDDSGNLGTVPA